VAALVVLSAAVVAPAVPAAAQTRPPLSLDPVCSSPDGRRWFEVINDGDTTAAWEAIGVDNPARREGTVGPHDIAWFSVDLPGERTTMQLWADGVLVDEERASDVDCSDPSEGYGPEPPYDDGSAPVPSPTPDPTAPSTGAPDPVPPTASPTPQPPPASTPPAAAGPVPPAPAPAPAPAVPPVAASPPAAASPQHRHPPRAAPSDAPPPPPADAATPPPDPGPQPSEEVVLPVLPDEPVLPTSTPQPVVVAPDDGEASIPGWMVQAAAVTVVGMGLVLVLVRNPNDVDGPAAGPHRTARRGPGGQPSPGAATSRRPAPSPGAPRSPGASVTRGTAPPPHIASPPGAGPSPGAAPTPRGRPSPVLRQPGARPWEVGAPRHPRRRDAPPALPERRAGDWSAWERSEDDGG